MKKLFQSLQIYYYYVTRVVWTPIHRQLNYGEHPVDGNFRANYPARLWPVIQNEERRDAQKRAFQESQIQWANTFGSSKPTTAGQLGFCYIIGFCIAMYFILFKAVLPILTAMLR